MRTKSVIVDLSRSTANGCPSWLQCGYSKFRYTQTLYGGRWGSTSLGTSTFLMWNFNYSLSPGVCWNMIFICFSWNWELARLEFENLAKIVIWRWMIWKKIKKIGEALYRGPQGPIWPKTASKMALYDQKWPSMTQNSPAWPQMALKHFSWVHYMILCHAGLPWGLFRGPHGPRGSLKRPHGGPIGI